MKKILTLLVFLLVTAAAAFAQLPDNEVIQLLKECNEKGMTQTETVTLLTSKGVTMEQMKRLKAQYENQVQEAPQVSTTDSRNKIKATESRQVNLADSTFISPEQRRLREQQEVQQNQLQQLRQLQAQLQGLQEQIIKTDTAAAEVFGRNLFMNPKLTFAPNLNMPTPDNYILGVGDEINISIWGSTELSQTKTISPEGRINLSGVGMISLNGLTMKQATTKLRQELGSIYGGLYTGEASLKVSLGNIRSIQVHVMGEIEVPGTYTLPSLATVFHSLYAAQGINKSGSLRVIRVVRNNKTIAEVDIYPFLISGNKAGDIVLQDGDVVNVQPYQGMVTVRGGVKRPMQYEMRTGETLENMLTYAGGLVGTAYRSSVNVVRHNERDIKVYNVDKDSFATFIMQDGDEVSVGTMLARFDNKVEIKGAVYKEGTYAIDDTLRTVKGLIRAAEGLREDAFMNRALLTREKEDWTAEMIAIDLTKLFLGEIPDITLRKNDALYIPSKSELKESYYVMVRGPVINPGNYEYAEGMTVEDLIIRAGGLKESAATVQIDISRRMKDPSGMNYNPQRSQTFSITITDGLSSDSSNFKLEPFDQIFLRKSPIYNRQNWATINGEVVFGGSYPLADREVRISDIIKKAGGMTPYAFVEGARLERQMTDEDRTRFNRTIRTLTQQSTKRDSLSTQLLGMDIQSYPVGFNMVQALANPGSAADIILQDGDMIIVPEYDGTVRISGSVMFPNAVVYQEKMTLKEYVKQAGGFSTNARAGKVFVVYLNGTIATGKSAKIRPGCEIIVPMKSQRKQNSLQEIMGLTSTTASMAAVIASMATLFK